MSKTTLRKRIALTAVAAIGAGLLSVVPVSTANAANNVAAPTTAVTNPISTAGLLNIASKLTASGDPAASGGASTLSMGLVSVSDIAGGIQEGTTQTAVLLSTGSIGVFTSNTLNSASFISVTGGTISKSSGATGISAGATVVGTYTTNSELAALVRPSSGSTSMVIRLYTATNSTWGSLAVGLAAPTLGTLTGQITVTIASVNSSGVMDPAKSNLYTIVADGSDNAAAADVPTAAIKNNGEVGCVNVQLNDGYGQDITTTAGLLTATATNNAVLAFAGSACAAGLTAGSAFYTSSPADVSLSIAQPASGAALSTTVTILYNNVVVGTKSFVIRGKVAKVTVSSPKIAATNATTASTATVKFEDAAGNVVYPTSGSAIYPLSSTVFGITASTAKSGYVTAAAITSTSADIPDAATSTTGKIQWTCGLLSTKQSISMTYVNIDGSTVVSNAFDASCGDSPYSYSASFDKTSYAPGEIATLSVTFKDKGGSLSNDASAISTHVSAGVTDASISAAGLTMVGAPTSVDRTTNGVKKYTFTVGSTEGSYNAVVNFPTIDDPATVSYTIKAGTASVSNADVLKSIVALIASINKQIQALQKLILKR
jgi:trimeric autotransporter adhesin